MRRFPVSLAIACAASVGAPTPRVLAQSQPRPAAAYVAEAVDGDLPAGLDAAIPVRIADARTGAPSADARLVSVRLTSPFNAAVPVRSGAAGVQPGVRLFRADLLSPGPWTLELALAAPGGAIIRTSIGFTVAATSAPALSPDPLGASEAPAAVSVSPAEPSIVTRGPGALGEAVAPTLVSPSSRAASPPSTTPASSFCAECAEEAPH